MQRWQVGESFTCTKYIIVSTFLNVMRRPHAGTYSLLTAPPWSQSHGLQPSMSLDRPQCCGYEEQKAERNDSSAQKHREEGIQGESGSVPDTDHSCVLQRGVCRSSVLCLTHRSFLPAACPARYRYKLPKHRAKQQINPRQPV